MSDYVYVDVESPKVTETEILEATPQLVEALVGRVPHNLLSHLRLTATRTDTGYRLEPSLGATSIGALLGKGARRQYGLAIIEAVVEWVRERGWRASVLLEGHRGNQSLPDELVHADSLESAIASRPKGPYVIRVRNWDAD